MSFAHVNPIRILSIKTFINNTHNSRIIDYSTKLRLVAQNQKGYLCSASYWGQSYKNNDKLRLYTISHWKRFNDWDNWYHSLLRNKFHEEILDDSYIGNIIKTNHVIKLNKVFSDQNIHLL